MRGLRQWQWAAYAIVAAVLWRNPAAGQQWTDAASRAEEKHRLAVDALVKGDLNRAEEIATGALKRWTADACQAERFRLQLAKVSLYRGDNRRVLTLLEPAIRCSDTDSIQRKLMLSLTLARMGQAEEAKRMLSAAAHAPGFQRMQAEIAFARGNFALEFSHFTDAERWFRHSLVLAQSKQDAFLLMQILGNLGVAALQEEQYETAQAMLQRASGVARSLGAQLAQEKYLGNAAVALYKSGDYERARALYLQAEEQAIAIGAAVDQAQWQNNFGLCQWKLHHLPEARVAFESALQTAVKIGNQEEVVDVNLSLGSLLAESDPQQAEQHARAALITAQRRENRTEVLSARILIALMQAERSDGNFARQERAVAELQNLLTDRALTPSLRWQILDELGRMAVLGGQPQRADRFYRAGLAAFSRQRQSLTSADFQIPFREAAGGLLNDYMEHLISTGREWEALKVLDESRARALDVEPRPAAGLHLSYTSTLARSVHGVVLVYYVRPHASFLWAIGAQGRGFYRIAGDDVLRPLLTRHQTSILASRELTGAAGKPGQALYQALIAPAAQVIGSASRAFLMVEGDLTQVNFETLLTPGLSSHLWIEDVAITNARSLREVQSSARRYVSLTRPKLLLVSVADEPNASLPILRNAADEAQRVMARFPRSNRTLLQEGAATPASYRASKPIQFNYIHFIAHGTADHLNPLHSALLLAGKPDQSYLYAHDILRQPLHAELVTLSSCFGSGARTYSGEGPVGMAWAFQRAGARNVIGALWQVSDAVGPVVMDKLYDGLLRGLPPDLALREAKLQLLHQPGVLHKPFYWASFQLY